MIEAVRKLRSFKKIDEPFNKLMRSRKVEVSYDVMLLRAKKPYHEDAM